MIPNISIGHKTSETLLGIETLELLKPMKSKQSHKTSETLLGIETAGGNLPSTCPCHKTSETLLGIETHVQLSSNRE